MIVKDFKYYPYTLNFKIPFQTSTQSFSERKIIFVKIKDEQNNTGIGEISPLPEFGSETIKEAFEELKFVENRLSGQQFSDKLQSIKTDINNISKLPTLKYALSQALLHILLQRECSINELFKDIENKSMAINGLISIKSVEDTINEVEQLYELGYKTIKLKIGRDDFQEDFNCVEKIYSRFGNKIALRLDVNGKWNYDNAEQNLNELQHFPIEYVEQPVMNKQELFKLAEKVRLSLAPDESIRTIKDANFYIESDNISYIVVKPSLIGSFFEILDIIDYAEKKNKKIIISSSLESDIGKSSLILLAALTNHNSAHGLAVQDLFDNDNLPKLFKSVKGSARFNVSEFISINKFVPPLQ